MAKLTPITKFSSLFISTTLSLGLTACDQGDEFVDLEAADEDLEEELDVVSSEPGEVPEHGVLGPTTEHAQTQWAMADDITIAQAFRPRINMSSSHNCFPLTFKEISTDASDDERDELADRCNDDYNSDWVIFASVKRPTGTNSQYWDDESFRVTYGVAFGWQENHLDNTEEWIVDLVGGDGDLGSHGEDAQYVVVDVVQGQFTAAWADLHRGSFSRTRGDLSMHDSNHVNVWAGKWYNSLKLVDDTTTACKHFIDIPEPLQYACAVECSDWSWSDFETVFDPNNQCGVGDAAMNFGDPVGTHHQVYGKLVMVEDVCATQGSSYTSPDNITYAGTRLEALKAYIGCDGAEGAWDSSYMSKTQYSDPYGLPGCDSGDTGGGDICYASTFTSALWRTFDNVAKYIEPATAGTADVDYQAGDPFSDLNFDGYPASITVRAGDVLDQVSVTYDGGEVKTHGGAGGSPETLDGLLDDPVVYVRLCEGTKDGKIMAGHITLVTREGRMLSQGDGSSNCKTIAPPNTKFRGFFGRSATYVHHLGSYWGDVPGESSFCALYDGETIALKTDHDKYVRATQDGEGWRIDQQDGMGPWKQFDVTCDGGLVSFETYHGRYVRAGDEDDSYFVDQATDIGTYERFLPIPQSNGKWAFLTYHNRYLEAGQDGSDWRIKQDSSISAANKFEVIVQ